MGVFCCFERFGVLGFSGLECVCFWGFKRLGLLGF